MKRRNYRLADGIFDIVKPEGLNEEKETRVFPVSPSITLSDSSLNV